MRTSQESILSVPEAKFKINVKEGSVELEGNEQFVNKHLEKFEGIFKLAIQEAVKFKIDRNLGELNNQAAISLPSQAVARDNEVNKKITHLHKHIPKPSAIITPLPIDLKENNNKIGLREFYKEKQPANHYEKVAVIVYYLTKFNNLEEVKFGEILTSYEEVNDKKPSIVDIVKNSVRYKGWLESGKEKFTARMTISGENFVKFDLPHK
ncbi:MAG TPA: hypothetical protein VH415_01310 [Nitrososphaeraceae archaeon]|jgi:hypothetical protein